MLAKNILRMIDWFVPPQVRVDEATLGRGRIFAFSHIFGPAMGHSISVYLYFADRSHGLHFWLIVACISAFWTLPFALTLGMKRNESYANRRVIDQEAEHDA